MSLGIRHLAACLRIDENAFAGHIVVAVKIASSLIQPPYHVFIDDSTQHRYGPKVVAVAAYVGTIEAWADFERDWAGVLRKGPFEFFHTTDFLSRKPPFNNGWTDPERNEFMERITVTASEYPTLGVGAALVCEEYERLISPSIQEGWRDPRLFAFHSLLLWLHGMLAHPRSTLHLPKPLNFLIERQRGFVGNAMELFYAIKDKFDKTGLFGEIQQGDDITYPPLQGVDVLAYEATRQLVERFHVPNAEERKPFEVLRRKSNIMPLELREILIQKYVDFLAEEQLTRD
jgi:hypothetical protein